MEFSFLTETVLPRLLAASVQSTLVVAVVLLLCRLLPRLPAATRAALWWLVALQLVVGLLWSSPLALPLLPAAMAELGATAATVAVPDPALGGAAFAAGSQPVPLALSAPLPAGPSTWSWTSALAIAWLLGLACMVVRSAHGLHQARHLLRQSRDCRDLTLLGALRLASAAHGLPAPPRLRVSAAVRSPQLVGPWRPVLLLPASYGDTLSADELDMALTHELTHLQRRDLWLGLLPAAAQHLFFFHPLAHLAAREYALAREAACDAAVVQGHRHCAGDYGRLLVRLGVAPPPSGGLASASPDFHILKRRLTMLQQTATTPRAIALMVTLAVAVLGVVPYRIVAAPLPPAAPAAPAAPGVPGVPGVPGAPVAPAPLAAPAAVVAPAAAPMPAAPRPPAAVPAPPSPSLAPRAPPVTVRPPSPPRPSTRLAPGRPVAGVAIQTLDRPESYVLLRGDRNIVIGTDADVSEARRLAGDADVLLVRRGPARYLVRDPATMARFGAAFDAVAELGNAQAALGRRQGEIGRQQGRIGSRQGELGALQGKAAAGIARQAAEQARLAAPGALERRTVVAVRVPDHEEMAALAERQRALAAEMQAHGRVQAELGREQRALGLRQKQTTLQAERKARAVADEAIAQGLAVPVRD